MAFLSDRIARIDAALAERLGSVRVAVEAVYHRHNTSAILRTCEAMGVHHVHLIDGHFKPSRGAARGTERWLQIHEHPSPEHAIAELRAAGFAIWIADLASPPVPPEAVPVDQPVCLWFGAELIGVGPAAKAAADGVVTVPMRGLAQSLNVSVACALTVRPVAERARAALGAKALLPDAERAEIRAAWLARDEHMTAAIDAGISEAT